MSETKPNIVFFGTPDIAVYVLEELAQAHILPTLIVTNPDKPQGRGLAFSHTPVKSWALQHGIEIFQPDNLNDKNALMPITSQTWDLSIVVAYGQIIPKWLVELPRYKTLNVHPSMLPKLRGASPIRTSILGGFENTGVTIMLLDEKIDHGPILTQERLTITTPIAGGKLDQLLAKRGGKLLAEIIPRFIAGQVTPQEQDHTQATFCKKITKDQAELKIDPFLLPQGEEAYQALLKICAYDLWPTAFFMYENKRIKITDATQTKEGKLDIHKVIPEGKNEMTFAQFLQTITKH